MNNTEIHTISDIIKDINQGLSIYNPLVEWERILKRTRNTLEHLIDEDDDE